MDSFESIDFDAVLGDSTVFDETTAPTELGLLVAQIEAGSQEGNLPVVKEAFARLRHADGESSILTQPGSALLVAIEHGKEDVVTFLLSEGVKISGSHFKQATQMKARTMLQIMLDYGWDINEEVEWLDPPALAYAVEDVSLTTWFLDRGADPNASCFFDITPLSAAVQYSSFPIIEMLFDRGGSIKHGQLLHYAVRRQSDDRLAVVTYILNKGAPANTLMYQNHPRSYAVREPFGLGTPLHDAAALGHEDVLRLLVENGTDVHIQDSNGFLAYARAQANHHVGAAEYLRGLV